jgi:hypothetical protein
MKTGKRKSKTRPAQSTDSGRITQTPREPGHSKVKNTVTGTARSKATERRRAAALLLTMTYIECIRVVLAVYPDAIFEWPQERCSISAYPRGPEISRRFTSASPAWIDAVKRIIKEIGVAATRKAIRKSNFLRAKRLEQGDLRIVA